MEAANSNVLVVDDKKVSSNFVDGQNKEEPRSRLCFNVRCALKCAVQSKSFSTLKIEMSFIFYENLTRK